MQKLTKNYMDFITKDEYISKKEIDSFLCENKSEIDELKKRKFNLRAINLNKTLSNISNFAIEHNNQYVERKLIQEEEYFDKLFRKVDPKIKLDNEQRKAILDNEDYSLIVAGAGSGKTTTIVGKVKYLIDKKNVVPKDILLISYTNKAVLELKERLTTDFNINIEVKTFHKLGMEIIKNHKVKNYNILSNSYYVIANYFEEELLKKEENLKNFITFFALYFQDKGYQLKEKNTNKLNVLNGEEEVKLKKMDKKMLQISNFLYLNSVDYFIEDEEIYINCKNKMRIEFGNKRSTKKIILGDDYLNDLAAELKEKGIETSDNDFVKILETMLLGKKDEDLMKLINFSNSFIKLYKNKGFNKDDLDKFAHEDERFKMFVNYMKDLYNYYDEELKINNYIDFEDMINISYNIIKNNEVNLNYKYIIIDEYQDISFQRFNLTKALADLTNAKIIAVGDDWQAIFAFAGSDIKLFTMFKELMGYGSELKIINTYRNSQELIDIAGSFVMRNKKQIKKDLLATKNLKNPIVIYEYKYDLIGSIKKSLDNLIEEYGENQKILIIGRYNFEKYNLINSGIFKEYSEDKLKYAKNPKIDITFLTVHSSKGLGFDNVILINAKDDYFGFPSKVNTDPIFSKVLGRSFTFELEEERRLFYVALTRSKNKIHLITQENKKSDFIKEIEKYGNVSVFED